MTEYNDLISIREFARRIGVDEKAIRRHIERGRFAEAVTKEDGKVKIRFSLAVAEAKNIGVGSKLKEGEGNKIVRTPIRKPAKIESKKEVDPEELEKDDYFPDEQEVSLAEALKKKENFVAGLKKLEFLEKKGMLVSRAEVRTQLFEYSRDVRSEFESLPGRVAHKLAAIGNDPTKISEVLAIEIRNSLVKVVSDLKMKRLKSC